MYIVSQIVEYAGHVLFLWTVNVIIGFILFFYNMVIYYKQLKFEASGGAGAHACYYTRQVVGAISTRDIHFFALVLRQSAALSFAT